MVSSTEENYQLCQMYGNQPGTATTARSVYTAVVKEDKKGYIILATHTLHRLQCQLHPMN